MSLSWLPTLLRRLRIVNDDAPQLGGNLDTNGKTITNSLGVTIRVDKTLNATGFQINGVPVSTSTDTYWTASGGELSHNGGAVKNDVAFVAPNINRLPATLVLDFSTPVFDFTGQPRWLIAGSGVVAMGADSTTGERGVLVKMINRTGGASVKGSLVSPSTTADKEAILQANEYDTIGVVQESGVAEGSEMWVWISGFAQVLFKDSTAAVRGNILIAADTDGRGAGVANPGSGLPATDTHFKECGHVLESKNAGTNVLVLCNLHFN
jgi:hypothetical protein